MNYKGLFLLIFSIFIITSNSFVIKSYFLKQEIPFKGMYLAYELKGTISRNYSQTHVDISAYITFKEKFDEYSIADIEVLKLGYRYISSLRLPNKLNTLFYLKENLSSKKGLKVYTGSTGRDLLFINYKLPHDEANFFFNRTLKINFALKNECQAHELIYIYESIEEGFKVKVILYYDFYTKILILGNFVLDAKDRRIEGIMSLKETNAFNQKCEECTSNQFLFIQLLVIFSFLILLLILRKIVPKRWSDRSSCLKTEFYSKIVT
jgi:hypothetical protein